MMNLAASSSNENQLCKLCKNKEQRYVCPKCNIGYCSVECYKCPAHLECSESFYKKCVEEELQAQQCDSQMKQKTLDILQRIYNDDIEDNVLEDILREDENELNDEEPLDSDDENIEPLEKRLENINLDDANELWSALTTTERQQFEALIQNGDATKLLPSWNPWWTYYSEKKLVEDLTEKDQDKAKYIDNCPKVLNIPALQLTFRASPYIKYSIINTIYAYAYTVLHFNGEHYSTPLDAVYVFLRICDAMRINRIFKDITSSIENVLLEITNCDALSADQETIVETKKAGDAILNGPEEDNKSFYLLSALSDLHGILQKAKKEISSHKSKSTNTEFKAKFQSNINLASTDVTKKNLTLYQKKIEFYIAWLKSQSQMFDISAEN